MGSNIGQSVHNFGPDRNTSTITWWIARKCCSNIHGPQRMDFNDFVDPLTFPAGRSLHLSFETRIGTDFDVQTPERMDFSISAPLRLTFFGNNAAATVGWIPMQVIADYHAPCPFTTNLLCCYTWTAILAVHHFLLVSDFRVYIYLPRKIPSKGWKTGFTECTLFATT